MMIAEILRLVARAVMVAQGEEQCVVRHLHDAAAEMVAARQRPLLPEDDLTVFELRRLAVREVARASDVRPPPSTGSAKQK